MSLTSLNETKIEPIDYKNTDIKENMLCRLKDIRYQVDRNSKKYYYPNSIIRHSIY